MTFDVDHSSYFTVSSGLLHRFHPARQGMVDRVITIASVGGRYCRRHCRHCRRRYRRHSRHCGVRGTMSAVA